MPQTEEPIHRGGHVEDCLHDLIYDWAYRRCPILLCDEETFESLVGLVHELLLELQRKERTELFARMTKVMPC
jgi:hypothetical protein